MFINLYFIVTRLPDSLRSMRDHFLTLDPTSLTVDLLEQHLLAAETSAVAVGAARGTSRSPFFEGCSPSPLFSSFACAAAADVSVSEDVGAASTSTKRRNSKGKGGRGSGGGSGGGGGGSGSGSGGSGGTGDGGGGSGGGSGGSGGSGGRRGGGTSGGRSGPQRGGPGGGRGQQQQRPSETQTPQQLREWLVQRGPGEGSETCPYRPRWAELLRSGVAIFDLDFDVIISAMYGLSFSAEDDCYRCVPPDPGIAAAALGASASNTPPGTAPAEALHTFTLDFGASCCFFHDSTTLTPLPAPVPVRLADPSGGPVVARSSTVLPCPAVPSGSLSGLHLPSFSTNLVSTTALQDAMVTTTTPGGQCVSICMCTRTGHHLATFTRRPGSSLYTLATELPQVAVSAQVSASGQVATSCSCRLLSHQTLLWHHRLGHPSLPRLCGMHSRLLVSGLPRLCLPCRPHLPHHVFLALRGGSAPLLTPPRFPRRLLPCRPSTWTKGEVSAVLIPWIRTVRLQLRERFGQDLPVLCLHSDRGGEFSSDLLRDFVVGRAFSSLMEVARTSMIHAAAPHFLWPFAIRYAAHQLNLWPRVSLPETSPTLRWTGKVGDASVFRGPAPSGVSQVDPLLGTATVQVAVVPGATPGAASGGAESGGAEPGGAGSEGAGSGGPVGASPRLSSQQLREWLVQRPHCRSGAPGAGEPGDAGAGGAAITTGAGDPTEPGAAGARGAGAGVVGVGGPGAGGAGAAGAGAVDPGAGGAGGTVRPRPYFVPLH
ncbi:unnamed protein product [Closterium sp. NIES-54]